MDSLQNTTTLRKHYFHIGKEDALHFFLVHPDATEDEQDIERLRFGTFRNVPRSFEQMYDNGWLGVIEQRKRIGGATEHVPSTVTLTVDIVVIADNDDVLLIKRKYNPFKGMWALPGGHVEENETTQDAAIRELKEETGIDSVGSFQLLDIYTQKWRDPRGRYASVVYVAQIHEAEPINAGDDAVEVQWAPIDTSISLAFDHKQIVMDAYLFVVSDRSKFLR